MGGFTSRNTRSAAALLCCLLLFAGLNIVASHLFRGARIDLTEQRLYTLSAGTRATLARIDEPITIRFYYSKRLGDALANYALYAQNVQEMLDEYAAHANGKLRIERIDPEPYSPEEDRAVASGMRSATDPGSGEQVYFGLVGTNSTDDQQIIPFFLPNREIFVEYDLTRLIHALAVPTKKPIGLMSTLPVEGGMTSLQPGGQAAPPFTFLEQLRQLQDVRGLGTGIDRIPDDIDTLILIHPRKLSDETQYALDQFVLKGGKVLAFVDPLSEYEAGHPTRDDPPGAPTASDLDRLLKAWGVEMAGGTVAADRFAARKVAIAGMRQARPIDYLAWLSLGAANLSREDPITASLDQLNMATAGILSPVKGATTRFQALVSTSPSSMRIPAERIGFRADPAALLADFRAGNERLTLAAHVTGPAKTAFPERAKPGQIRESVQPINVVVVADTDMLDDRFWVGSNAGNGDFVANAVDVLSGSADLVNLRSRGTAQRPFEAVKAMQQEADDRYAAQERALQDKLKDTEARLKGLLGRNAAAAGGTVTLDDAQARAIDDFRAEMIQTRQQLRAVHLALRQDIDRLRARLEFANIALVPILVGTAAVILEILRLRRRKRRAAIG